MLRTAGYGPGDMQPTRMRRPKRHRWITLSAFLIVYSVFHAAKSTTLDKDNDKIDVITQATSPQDNIEETASTSKEKDFSESPKEVTPYEKSTTNEEELEKDDIEESGKKKAMKGVEEEEEGEKKKQKDAGYEDIPIIFEDKNAIPTVHPLRNCTPPAIEQFPRDVIGQTARKHGGLLIHVLVAVFTFIGLAIVCDEYFVSSLDRICEELRLAPDVAGATFMAAGSSAPELATVIIGVFCAQDDIGVSGVIGSAVFNIMFVISVCALCAGTVSHLNWWPLCRDCFFYAVSILVMLCTIANGYVSWPEALFMLIMYGVYCVALRFNTTLEAWAITLPLPFKLPTREEQAALVSYKSGGQPIPPAGGADGEYTQMEGQTKETSLQDVPFNQDAAYENAGYNAETQQSWNPNQTWDPNQSWGDDQQHTNTTMSSWDPNSSWNESAAPSQPAQPPPAVNNTETSPQQQPARNTGQEQQQPVKAAVPAYYKAKEYNPETAVDPLIKPAGANQFRMAYWYVTYPIHWSCRHTMPDCRGRWYPITFIISMLWISFYSYFMVWMITIIGFTLGIPDTVMGLTFVAAGVSVPDALSSLAVIKEGYGDMAVSNAVGSNVFDILVCLGLPWFMQTAIIHPGSHVNVISKGLIYSTLSLLSTVVFLVVATHANGWKLDRKYGAVLMVWYLLFITFASLYELNIFGDFHPPDCGSSY